MESREIGPEGQVKLQDAISYVALILLVAIGSARIISTYRVFNQTTDEPAHLVTGMEWLQRGTYTLEPLHPPLARVAIALSPYLSGLRVNLPDHMWEQGNRILFAHGQYLRNLSLARLGVLPFFLLATIFTWSWSKTHYGRWPAFLACLLFTTSPVVIAHAGLATTDMAVTAMFAGSILSYVNLLNSPSYSRAIIFGVAVGTSILCKFSAFLFLPAAVISVLMVYLLIAREPKKLPSPAHFRWSRALVIVLVTTMVTIWAGYRFSVDSITYPAARPHPTLDHVFGSTGILHNGAYRVVESPWIPAPAFFRGLAELRAKNADGPKGYLLGSTRHTGWWYFFPVALGVKTTIPFLVLIAVGAACLLKKSWRARDWIAPTPVVVSLAILLVCMPSHINIGLRHILPAYPLFAITAGFGACQIWKGSKQRAWGAVIVLTLLVLHLVSSIRAHPDYLAFFNELAGRHPENILVDSDLDWGQDLFRLSAVLKQRHVSEVSIAYAGSKDIDLHQFELPPFQILAPYHPTSGWIAISLLQLKTGGASSPQDGFSWLEKYEPEQLVGKSIRLYYVPESRSTHSCSGKSLKEL